MKRSAIEAIDPVCVLPERSDRMDFGMHLYMKQENRKASWSSNLLSSKHA
jgi:hypothetical protein